MQRQRYINLILVSLDDYACSARAGSALVAESDQSMLHAHPEPMFVSIVQEQEVVNAFTADLYVATLDKLSLRGSVTNGFDGHHELVLGGYSQVGAWPAQLWSAMPL